MNILSLSSLIVLVIVCSSSVASNNQPTICSSKPTDFLNLEDNKLQSNLFEQIKSTRKEQYPNNDQETSIMVDLTAEYLSRFLQDIDSDSLAANHRFEQEYHFNLAPKGYTDPPKCRDKITVTFDSENCSFRLVIYNTFLVEPDWCTESMVVYGFRIEEDSVVGLWRQEAG